MQPDVLLLFHSEQRGAEQGALFTKVLLQSFMLICCILQINLWFLDSNFVCRAYVLMSFECGASSSSRKTLSCRKCCALVEPTLSQNELRKSSQLIQYREFISPKSSLKELACEELVGGMDDQWSNNTSYPDSVSRAHYSVNKRDVEKQVQDHQLHHPQGGTYFTGLSKKEIERRRKIGAANKGQVPWTKGKKWSEGTTNLSLTTFVAVVLQLDAVSYHFLFTEEYAVFL